MPLFTTMLGVCGKVNFTNLSRYSDLSERTYRRQYQQDFEFARFNQAWVAAASRAGVVPNLKHVRDLLNSKIQARAEQKCPGSVAK